MDETILQFGTGRFLRCFVGMFAQELNDSDNPIGKIVAAQSTGSERAEQINARCGVCTAAIRGLMDGSPVDRLVEIGSISRAVSANEQWGDLLEFVQSDKLRYVVSNTTEAGLALAAEDAGGKKPPRSYPAKLLALLATRYETVGEGVTVLPCELVEQNADRLLELVLEQARQWRLPDDLIDWLQDACSWHNTLVDRIVAAPPEDDPAAEDDPLFAVAEPFALWVIEGERVPALDAHPTIQFVDRLEPYHLRKVRILNGAHTALVAKALPLGIETVRQAVEDKRIRPWLENLLFEEIVPTIADRVDGAETFARSVLERFANPFLEHRLADIALHHDKKLETRLRPTFGEFHLAFGKKAPLLGEILGEDRD